MARPRGKSKFFNYGKASHKAHSAKMARARANGKSGNVRKGSRRSRPTALSHSPNTFPKNLYTKLTYTDLDQINCVGGTIGQLTYNINDCFDPYNPIGGHQPRFFDALCGPQGGGAPYSNFRVFGCLVDLTFINLDPTVDQAEAFCHWRLSNDSQLTDILDIGEVYNTKHRTVGSGNSAKGIRRIKKFIKMAPMLGVKDLKDDPNTLGSDTASPSELVQLDIGVQPFELVNVTYDVITKLTYFVQFTNQVYITKS